jgi:hypothetical protein
MISNGYLIEFGRLSDILPPQPPGSASARSSSMRYLVACSIPRPRGCYWRERAPRQRASPPGGNRHGFRERPKDASSTRPEGRRRTAARVRRSVGQGGFSSIKRRAVLPPQPKADFDSGDALRGRMHSVRPRLSGFLPFLPSLGFRSSPFISSVWPWPFAANRP